MYAEPKYTEKIRSLTAQRHRLTTNKLFDPEDPQVKSRLEAIETELGRLAAITEPSSRPLIAGS